MEDVHDDMQQCARYFDFSYNNSSQHLLSAHYVPGTVLRSLHKCLILFLQQLYKVNGVISVLQMKKLRHRW